MGQTSYPASGVCDTIPGSLTTIFTTSAEGLVEIVVNNPTTVEQTCTVSGGVSGKVKVLSIPSYEDRMVFRGNLPSSQAVQLGASSTSMTYHADHITVT